MTENKPRRFEVIREDIHGQLALVLEGRNALRADFNRKIDTLPERPDICLARFKASHDDLDARIPTLKRQAAR